MKYYIGQLWQDMNSENAQVRHRAEALWEQNDRIYSEYFQKIKHKLPNNVLKTFEKNEFFHDWKIQRISLSYTNSIAEIELMSGINKCCIIMIGITDVSMHLCTQSSFVNSPIEFGYCEFELLENGKIQFSVLCAFENEMSFICKKFTVI